MIKVQGLGIGPIKLSTPGREEVERIAGTKVVPVLVTDDGEVINESQRIAEWARWAAEPIDEQLLKEVLEILRPIHNWFYVEGRPENNDAPVPA